MENEIAQLQHQLKICVRQSQGLDPIPFISPTAESATYPSIFFNTLPKSGSVFLMRSLQQSVNMEFQKLGYGYFPHDLVDYHKAKTFGNGGRIGQEHLDASPQNIKLLEIFVQRWVLHLRDPRAAMLSWIHHLDRMHQEGYADTVQFSDPFLPDDYFQWELGKKIDWQIDHYLAHAITWIDGWGTYRARNPQRMLVTSYKELNRDATGLITKVLAYYGIPLTEVKLREKTMANHFRKGEIGEWKEVYSSAQRQKTMEACAPLRESFADVDYFED